MPDVEAHVVTVKQTAKFGWHYATCSCGWRSLASPPLQREIAERRGDVHLLTANQIGSSS